MPTCGEGNFSLQGLLGFDLHGKTARPDVGTGKIGGIVAETLLQGSAAACWRTVSTSRASVPGFSCRGSNVGLCDEDRFLKTWVDRLTSSLLHCPLTPKTHHLIDHRQRGGHEARRHAHQHEQRRAHRHRRRHRRAQVRADRPLGLDVYEEEARYFYEDYSSRLIDDDTLSRLLTFPNVIVTSHQGFFTREALEQIARTTLGNVSDFAEGPALPPPVRCAHGRGRDATAAAASPPERDGRRAALRRPGPASRHGPEVRPGCGGMPGAAARRSRGGTRSLAASCVPRSVREMWPQSSRGAPRCGQRPQTRASAATCGRDRGSWCDLR